ncbi:MAG: 4-carboxymuconolactone decarboxylase [Acidimicrobiia bacterium]
MPAVDSRYEQGMEIRRQVLGDDYVDRAMANTTDLDSDFQRWITETAWGGVWGRPGLERKVKSLITIAVLAALGHDELEVHLRAAANTGATPADVAEALMHVAVYAGVPAANHAFKVAKDIFEGP